VFFHRRQSQGAAAPAAAGLVPPLSGFVTPARRATDQSSMAKAPPILYREEAPRDREADVVGGRPVRDLGLGRLRKGTQEYRAEHWNDNCYWFSPLVHQAPLNFPL
jgi:hypothetical protein